MSNDSHDRGAARAVAQDLMDRQEHWKRVSGLFKHVLWISLLLCVVAHFLAHIPEVARLVPEGEFPVLRTWIYVVLMYAIAVPVLFAAMVVALSSYRPPHHALGKRLVIALSAVLMCALWILSPLAVLLMGHDAAGRAHLAYLAFTGHFIGTVLTGALLFYSVSIAAWLMLVGTVKLWSSPNKGV